MFTVPRYHYKTDVYVFMLAEQRSNMCVIRRFFLTNLVYGSKALDLELIKYFSFYFCFQIFLCIYLEMYLLIHSTRENRKLAVNNLSIIMF